jgi:hypothetical protein
LPTNIGYYSKKKKTKNMGFRPTNSGSISKFSLTNTARNESNPRPASYMRYTGPREGALPRHIARSQETAPPKRFCFCAAPVNLSELPSRFQSRSFTVLINISKKNQLIYEFSFS